MDSGVTIRSRDGRHIHMYKKQPGLYLDVMGNEVSGEDAAAVGFPVKEHRKEAAIQKKVQKAKKKKEMVKKAKRKRKSKRRASSKHSFGITIGIGGGIGRGRGRRRRHKD